MVVGAVSVRSDDLARTVDAKCGRSELFVARGSSSVVKMLTGMIAPSVIRLTPRASNRN
jgi:hypothetical protein